MINGEWSKSGYSNAGSECLECRTEQSAVRVRDTQHRDLTTLPFPPDAWHEFISGVKSGDL
ncbi:hypothetical protein GCM10023224_21000 [Streptomonospora halophila]|uniref:DUF397 domain-containing protein n=1 Tax=Streptomonospora halophila TaxID=427369 RepID=A0ABP9GDL0_9ACTN